MNTTEHILHIAKLNNQCPECSKTDGLEISFVQEENHTKYYSKIQKEVSDTLYCTNCKSVIYPVNWNEDIDRIYHYHKKQAIPIAKRLRLKPNTNKIIIGVSAFVVLILILLLIS